MTGIKLASKYAFMQRHNLNIISGAGKIANYFVNAGYLKAEDKFKTEADQPVGL